MMKAKMLIFTVLLFLKISNLNPWQKIINLCRFAVYNGTFSVVWLFLLFELAVSWFES